jgi:imidazolonepropionase-like amidohydrolase
MAASFGHKYQHLVTQSSCPCSSHSIQLLNNRISFDLSRRGFIAGISASVAGLGLPDLASAQKLIAPDRTKNPIVLFNLRLFDGVSNNLRDNVAVIIVGNTINHVGYVAEPKRIENARVIDCGGRTLMPGLIDAHWHAMLAPLSLPELMSSDVGFIHLAASAEAERTLMRGFTTVRDLAGPTFALKKAIDSGLISGPRIYPSGAIISQTAGHGDFRFTYETPRTGSSLSRFEVIGASSISDSPDAVRRATREQLMAGASQVKIAAGGGIISLYDPIDVNQSRLEEIRAAVEAAADWGTYVAAHVYLPVGIRRCLEAGVKSIEHGQLIDTETAKLLADKGAWWSLQAFLDDEHATSFPVGSVNYEKQKLVTAGTENSYRLAKKYKIKTAWGTDILFDAKQTSTQGEQLTKLKRWYTPTEILKQATSVNAELLKLAGHRNPYLSKLGVIEKDAYADMILVDGDPTTNISLIADPELNFKMIIKDGNIHKLTL